MDQSISVLLRNLLYLDSSAVVVITRPPEIIACLKLRLSLCNIFIIFDSHPRPSYPNGAGAIVNTSLDCTARRLTEILPSVQLQDGIIQWQAQLLSNCSGHVFVPRTLDSSAAVLWQSVLESSLAQLSMQADISDLRYQNLCLRSQNILQASEQKRLETDLKEIEERCQRQERAIQELRSSLNNTHSQYHPPNVQLRSLPRPPALNNPFIVLSRDTATSHATSSRSIDLTSGPFGSSNPFNTLSRDTATSHAVSSRPVVPPRGSPPPLIDLDGSYASHVQAAFDSEDRALTAERAALSQYATSHATNPQSAGPRDNHEGSPAHRDDDFSYAARLQSQFDSEDRELSAEHIRLVETIRPVFECGICMEEMPEDSVARPDPCLHAFCRGCMYEYVSTRLEEHKFPILCPTCTADKGKGKGTTGGTYIVFPSLAKMPHGMLQRFHGPSP